MATIKKPRLGGYILSIFSLMASTMNPLRLSAWALSHSSRLGGNLREMAMYFSSGLGGRPPGGLRRPPRLDFWVILPPWATLWQPSGIDKKFLILCYLFFGSPAIVTRVARDDCQAEQVALMPLYLCDTSILSGNNSEFHFLVPFVTAN